MNKELLEAIVERERHETSHLLHLMCTLLTGGLWVIVWIIMFMGNDKIQKECDAKIAYLEKQEAAEAAPITTNWSL